MILFSVLFLLRLFQRLKNLADFTLYLNAILKFSNNKEFDLKEFEIIEKYILNVYEKLDTLEIAPGSPVISSILNN